MLGSIFPRWCSVTAKKSLKSWPFLGWFMTLSNTVFIDRLNKADAMAAFAGAVKKMEVEKQSVYIFPEGTRSYHLEPDLLPFKKGAFHLAVQAKVPIVPVVVANYSNVLYVPGKVFTSGTIPVKGKSYNCCLSPRYAATDIALIRSTQTNPNRPPHCRRCGQIDERCARTDACRSQGTDNESTWTSCGYEWN
jgi:1-acyl-sn-glycerol-3-phosphate acyltransferase